MGLQKKQKAILPLPFPRSTNAPSPTTQNDGEIEFVGFDFFFLNESLL